MRKYLIPLLVIVILAASISVSAEEKKTIASNYPFETGLKLSRILDRQFVFTFVSPGCPHCQDYKEKILSDPEVKDKLRKHFVLSLLTVVSDREYKTELPEYGDITHKELAAGLKIRGTPTTFVFYPPNPGLFEEGRGITKFAGADPNPGTPPSPEEMVRALEILATESFKKDEKKPEDSSYYNYKPPVKSIKREDLNLLKEVSYEIPIITEKVELSTLPKAQELVVDLSDESSRAYAEKIISETDIKKVFIVES